MNNSKLCNSSTIDYSSPSVIVGYLEFGGLNRTELWVWGWPAQCNSPMRVNAHKSNLLKCQYDLEGF